MERPDSKGQRRQTDRHVGTDRPVLDTDIVLRRTIGMHHLPRAEDWPVTPTMWRGFELRPCDFFDRNPAPDLP